MKIFFYLSILIAFSSASAGSYDDFFRAVVRDDPDEIRTWVARGFDPNARDPKGQPAIIRALLAEANEAALGLAQLPGLDPNARNAAGETPLMMAALKGQTRVCQALLERGADIDPAGWTPLHYAAAGDSLPAAQLLLTRGARVDPKAPNRRTPLMMAALHASEEVVDLLLSVGADVRARDQNGASAADLARTQGRDRLAARLDPRALEGAGTR